MSLPVLGPATASEECRGRAFGYRTRTPASSSKVSEAPQWRGSGLTRPARDPAQDRLARGTGWTGPGRWEAAHLIFDNERARALLGHEAADRKAASWPEDAQKADRQAVPTAERRGEVPARAHQATWTGFAAAGPAPLVQGMR